MVRSYTSAVSRVRSCQPSDPNVGLGGEVAAVVARVHDAAGFEEHQLHFLFGDGAGLHAGAPLSLLAPSLITSRRSESGVGFPDSLSPRPDSLPSRPPMICQREAITEQPLLRVGGEVRITFVAPLAVVLTRGQAGATAAFGRVGIMAVRSAAATVQVAIAHLGLGHALTANRACDCLSRVRGRRNAQTRSVHR